MMIDPYTWMLTPILNITEVARNTVAVRVARPDDYDFTPGQYAIIRTEIDGTALIRQYSFSSDPGSPFLEFIVRRQPLGSVSSWFLDKATQGDLIRITKPYGRFVRQDTSRPAVYVAGGVGIAPFLSMVQNNPEKSSLLYSERSLEDVVRDKDLTHQLGDSFHLVLSGESGRINMTHFHSFLDPETEFFLCGSKQFVDSIENLLADHGIQHGRIRREAFTLQ